MSSSEGLARLKNWHKAAKALVVPSTSSNGTIRISDVRVRIAFVDESRLVLTSLDVPGDTRTVLLPGVSFACTDDSEADLELTLEDGIKLYLLEEK